MRIRWRDLELPTKVELDPEVSTDTYGRFIIEPFERGFGTTVGNSLRRILLSSLEGAAVTRVKMTGAQHEFSSLSGVLEDVTDIILNIKGLVVQMEGEGVKTMFVTKQGPGEVYGSDIQADPAITIVNGDQQIATLTDKVEFHAEMTVKTGRGYVTAEENAAGEDEIGVIPVDSVFSPVTRVRYKTEDTRVGQRVNYDRLVMEIWTKGTVRPDMALVEAAKILRKHLNPFVQYFEVGDQMVAEGVGEPDGEGIDAELQAKLAMPISELDLSVRANNCLDSAKITTVGQLVQLTNADLLRVRSFGKTSLREVKRKLADLGLALGMKVPGASGQAIVIEEDDEEEDDE
ncbi:MAG: DNA-directed RNA polymerase subunit alpha [Phycisphaerae bacterium]|nr:DNA-directed RNA polymerase subunit alpha [Phycisphaerae bacterium]